MRGTVLCGLLTLCLEFGAGLSPLLANDTSVVPEGNLATTDEHAKRELIDVLIHLKLDKEILEKAAMAWARGCLPEVFLLNAQRNVTKSQDGVARAVKTLRLQGMPTTEIQALHQEADRIANRKRDK
jgi:hypothetical protein